MRRVTCSLGTSLDGYTTDPSGSLAWAKPDDEVFAYAVDEVRRLGVHLLGRRLYEAMLMWETADDDPDLREELRDFAVLWRSLPKVVFSRTLTAVAGSYRLATAGLAAEIERWRREPGDGDIAIGGPTLAAEAARLGLVDEYRLRVHPVLLGGGLPFFAPGLARTTLELAGSRSFTCGVVGLRYRVPR